ncbi:hypothetical protein BN946_scf184783.g4 [Trametes cinnabarina]|uniref:Uncharacterized protein n=1 Tax=Pycnoporus cinnabarinus TaxID=5643 RepID=A0A060S6X4_PYCCI|nr:hypothetical protein BN946_scf184783.g4 [Trametes cinnabarina]
MTAVSYTLQSASEATGTNAASSMGATRVSAGVIIGLVVSSVAIISVAVLAAICLCSMRGQRARDTSHLVQRQSVQSFGNLSGGSTDRTTSVWSILEKIPHPTDGAVQPDAVLPRLSPNRRKPSIYAMDSDIAASIQDVMRLQAHANLEACPLDAARVDSPTLHSTSDFSTPPKSPVVPRKPAFALLSPEEQSPRKVDSPRSAKENPSTSLSRTPSTANSAMQHIWDSGFHVQRRSHLDLEVARASSVIDPHLFGGAKSMHIVVPDVPLIGTRGACGEP